MFDTASRYLEVSFLNYVECRARTLIIKILSEPTNNHPVGTYASAIAVAVSRLNAAQWFRDRTENSFLSIIICRKPQQQQ